MKQDLLFHNDGMYFKNYSEKTTLCRCIAFTLIKSMFWRGNAEKKCEGGMGSSLEMN